MNEQNKKIYDFLVKETPNEGGCMLCEVTYDAEIYDFEQHKNVKTERKEFFLVLKHKISNGYVFTINGRFFYDYDFVWENNNRNDWVILYKKEK